MAKCAKGETAQKSNTETLKKPPKSTRTLRSDQKKSKKKPESEKNKKRKEKIRKLTQQMINESDDDFLGDELTDFSEDEEEEDVITLGGIF